MQAETVGAVMAQGGAGPRRRLRRRGRTTRYGPDPARKYFVFCGIFCKAVAVIARVGGAVVGLWLPPLMEVMVGVLSTVLLLVV